MRNNLKAPQSEHGNFFPHATPCLRAPYSHPTIPSTSPYNSSHPPIHTPATGEHMDQKESIMKASNNATKVKPPPRPPFLDSGSTLYDSFELDSFKRQLDSAISAGSLSMPHLDPSSISARTFSMPHLRENRRHDPYPTTSSSSSSSGAKKQFWLKFPTSMQKLFRSVFGLKRSGKRSGSAWGNGGRVFVVYEKAPTLSTIPEGPEAADCEGFSPDIMAVVRRTASERIPAAAVVGITVACAN